jgi:hypothetical protein
MIFPDEYAILECGVDETVHPQRMPPERREHPFGFAQKETLKLDVAPGNPL